MSDKKKSTKSKSPRGRPRFRQERLSEFFPLRLTPSQRETIERVAQDRGLSPTDLVREALDRYFESLEE